MWNSFRTAALGLRLVSVTLGLLAMTHYPRDVFKALGWLLGLAVLALVVAVGLGLVAVPSSVQRAADSMLGSDDSSGDESGQQDRTGDVGGSREPESSSPPSFIASVRTSTEQGVPVYHVRPSRAGRAAVGDDLDVAWDQAVSKGVPDRAGLRQQFMCHPLSIVARAKSTWDLESWRPTVGLRRTILEACNPV